MPAKSPSALWLPAARRPRARRIGRQRQHGYVLLVVLAVSVLVITALGTLAKLSLRRGLEAADAERALQMRWGAVTLERAILAKAPEVFQQREELAAVQTPKVPPPPSIRAVLTLGNVTFDLLLGDEDAKLSLNSLYHHAGPAKTGQAVSRIVGPAVGRAVRLVPAVEPLLIAREGKRNSLQSDDESPDEEAPPIADAFRSWGEVFDLAALENGTRSDAALPNLTTGITCWGNGQLNFRRASDEAILAVAGSVIQDGGARRLLERYRSSPTSTLGVLLQTEVSGGRNRDELRKVLSETSTNFSLWIDASSQAIGSRRSFTVMRRDEEGVTRQSKFLH